MNSGFYLRARRQRNRVAVGPHPHATQAIDSWEADLGQIEQLSGQWQQVRLFVQHRGAHCLSTPAQNASPVFVRAVLQIQVQLVLAASFRNRHPVVAAKVAALAFDATLLVAASRVAELA
jgi:hypothetical protein